MASSDSAAGSDFMKFFIDSVGNPTKNSMVLLPETLGSGYIKTHFLEELDVMLQHYVLKDDLLIYIKAAVTERGRNEITFSFRNVLPKKAMNDDSPQQHGSRPIPSVQVSSAVIDIELFIPAGTPVNTIIIGIQADFLRQLLTTNANHPLLQNIFATDRPYLYDEILSPEIQQAALEMIAPGIPEPLRDFYLRLKAETLLYLFFVTLLKRQEVTRYTVSSSDVRVMYRIREQLLVDLSVPPNLTALARFSNMSESKMNKLFKQIFGNSIYKYYQVLRIHEAAHLLKSEKVTVSEAGYRLGFTNLSHFTRIFEKHMGYKPKKYAMQVA